MAENLFCEEQECGQLARVFGFAMGKKVRACHAHMQNLMQKATTVHDIAAFAFIETPKDGTLYEERRYFMEQARGNLYLLETECDRGWEEGKKTLTEAFNAMNAVVQKSFQKMQQRGQKCYEKMKQDLGDIRSHLKLSVQDRNFQLSSEEMAICKATSTDLVFDVSFDECRLPVVETLLSNLHVTAWDVKLERESDWRHKLLKSLSHKDAVLQKNEETSHRLRLLLTTPDERKAIEYLIAANADRNAKNFERALKNLQEGRDLLKETDDIDLCLKLNNSMAETYCMTERWEDALKLCQETLDTWGNTPHHCELLRTIFYLTQAHYQLKQDAQGYAVVEKWTAILKAESPRSQCILLCIQAITLRQQGEIEKAAGLYKTVTKLNQPFPYIIASSRCCMSGINQSVVNEQTAQPVKRYLNKLYCFPLCILIISVLIGVKLFGPTEEHANNLVNKAMRFHHMNMLKDAELVYLQAINVYSTNFPQSQGYAYCLQNLGSLYYAMKKNAEGEKRYMQAINIYSTHFPLSLNYAKCLNDMGIFYEEMGKHADSEKRYLQAIDILSIYFPQSESYAHCLFNLGLLYEKDKRKGDAVKQFERSRYLYQQLKDQGNAGQCDRILQHLKR